MSRSTPVLDRAPLPIPHDVQVGPGWTEQMIEMADHIGAYETLRLVEAFGGQRPYVPHDPAGNPFREVLSPEANGTISRVYGGARFWVPVGGTALARARRAPVVAAVRARAMTVADGARLLGTSRSYLAHLVNQTDEAADATPLAPRRRGDPRQIDLFADR